MADPYAGLGTAAATMDNVRGTDGAHGGHEEPAREADLTARQVLARLMPFLRGHVGKFALGFALSAVSVVAQLYVPILIGNAIDYLVPAGEVNFVALLFTLVRLALTVALAAVTQLVSLSLVSRLANGTVRDLRTAAFAKLDRLPVSYVDRHPHGDILARIASDVDQVGDGLLQGLTQLFSAAVTIVGTLAFMCTISVPVALVVALVTPLSIGVAALVARHSKASFAEQQRLQGALGGYVEELVGNQRLVAAFSQGERAVAGFAELNERLRVSGERAQFVSSLSNPSTRLVNNITYAVVALVGCSCVISGWPSVLTVGEVQSFLSYANQYMKPFNEVSSVTTQLQAAMASARRVIALLDAEEEAPDGQVRREGAAGFTSAAEGAAGFTSVTTVGAASTGEGGAGTTSTTGALSFEGVSFSYVPDRPLLRDISLDAAPGQRIALVGPTGCGKTTLINLLLRFYEPDAGSIRVDGLDASGLARADLRSRFGMVLQDTWLFTGTIRENLVLGRPQANDEEVMVAAMSARAHKFIMQLPDGYDTLIGEEGASLSAGQCQLLCIARAMLADAPILLLDEATSSIDTRTELQVQAAFDEMMRGRTTLVVAHRLSTIREADCILVMDAGRIVERGTHDELLKAGGFYRTLYESQFAEVR